MDEELSEPNEQLDRYLSALSLALRVFSGERGWDQYHTSRNLAIAVFSEAGELAHEFRWTETPPRDRVADELADVFIFTCMLADRMGINLAQSTRDKIARNAEKYPIPAFVPVTNNRRDSDANQQLSKRDAQLSAEEPTTGSSRNPARLGSTPKNAAPRRRGAAVDRVARHKELTRKKK